MTAEPAKTCLVCGTAVTPYLDLGRQPLANHLLKTVNEPYDAYALGLAACPSCAHGQLTHFVDPAALFRNYVYASGTSNTLRANFDWFASSLARMLPPGGKVLEIACNDGSLLNAFKAHGLDATGVDPAENLTAIAHANGHRVLTGFFPETNPDGTFDAIVAMNVAAHTPAPGDILAGVKKLLAADGVAFIQTSQALMLENGEFDTIYHEHYSFYTPRSMAELARRNGLMLGDMRLVTVHGGSMVYVLRHAGSSPRTIAFDAVPEFERPLPNPLPASLSLGLQRPEAIYENFARLARETMACTREVVDTHRAAGRRIALAGVAAKAMTFISAAGIEPDIYLDEAALKIGLYVPGARTPIAPLAQARELPDDTVFLIGAWNFADEIIGKIVRQRPGANSRFITAFPSLKERVVKSPCDVS